MAFQPVPTRSSWLTYSAMNGISKVQWIFMLPHISTYQTLTYYAMNGISKVQWICMLPHISTYQTKILSKLCVGLELAMSCIIFFKFTGYIVSDQGAIGEIMFMHNRLLGIITINFGYRKHYDTTSLHIKRNWNSSCCTECWNLLGRWKFNGQYFQSHWWCCESSMFGQKNPVIVNL